MLNANFWDWKAEPMSRPKIQKSLINQTVYFLLRQFISTSVNERQIKWMQKYFYIYENKYICTYIGEYKNKIMTAIAILIYDCALSSLLATIKSVSVKFDFETMEIHWINNPHLTSNT